MTSEDERKDSHGSLTRSVKMENGRRYASLTVFCSAVVTLVANITFPLLFRGAKGSDTLTLHHAASKKDKERISDDASLLSLWCFGHLVLAAIMLGTFLVHTKTQGIFLLSAIGIPWALTQWIPHAIVGREVIRKGGSAVILTTIHNSFVSAPQVLAGVLCSGLLSSSSKGIEGGRVVVLLRVSGFLSLATAMLIFGLRSNVKRSI